MVEEATTAPPWGIPDPARRHGARALARNPKPEQAFACGDCFHLFAKPTFGEVILPEHMFICRIIIIIVHKLLILFIFHTQFISHDTESIDLSAFKLSDNSASIRQRVKFRAFIHNGK